MLFKAVNDYMVTQNNALLSLYKCDIDDPQISNLIEYFLYQLLLKLAATSGSNNINNHYHLIYSPWKKLTRSDMSYIIENINNPIAQSELFAQLNSQESTFTPATVGKRTSSRRASSSESQIITGKSLIQSIESQKTDFFEELQIQWAKSSDFILNLKIPKNIEHQQQQKTTSVSELLANFNKQFTGADLIISAPNPISALIMRQLHILQNIPHKNIYVASLMRQFKQNLNYFTLQRDAFWELHAFINIFLSVNQFYIVSLTETETSSSPQYASKPFKVLSYPISENAQTLVVSPPSIVSKPQKKQQAILAPSVRFPLSTEGITKNTIESTTPKKPFYATGNIPHIETVSIASLRSVLKDTRSIVNSFCKLNPNSSLIENLDISFLSHSSQISDWNTILENLIKFLVIIGKQLDIINSTRSSIYADVNLQNISSFGSVLKSTWPTLELSSFLTSTHTSSSSSKPITDNLSNLIKFPSNTAILYAKTYVGILIKAYLLNLFNCIRDDLDNNRLPLLISNINEIIKMSKSSTSSFLNALLLPTHIFPKSPPSSSTLKKPTKTTSLISTTLTNAKFFQSLEYYPFVIVPFSENSPNWDFFLDYFNSYLSIKISKSQLAFSKSTLISSTDSSSIFKYLHILSSDPPPTTTTTLTPLPPSKSHKLSIDHILNSDNSNEPINLPALSPSQKVLSDITEHHDKKRKLKTLVFINDNGDTDSRSKIGSYEDQDPNDSDSDLEYYEIPSKHINIQSGKKKKTSIN
jgi:hypothetical protein